MNSQRTPALAFALVALLVATALSRPVLPVDETRYTGVAWEMLLRGDFLVPWQNGLPYSHKPPLLFWLMQAGWAVFGVNAWWPRVLPALFAAGSLWLLVRLARELWPEDRRSADLAAWILASCMLWTYFVGAIMFDMMLAFFALLGWLGLARAWRSGRASGFLLFAIGLGGGLMSKGPVALLHLLPVALFAPWWARGAAPAWRWWSAGVVFGVLGGALIVLAWAVPAGISGGEEYRNAIFWGQTSGRVTESFAHRRPFWFYLPMLPLILAPWTLWPSLYRSLRAASWSEPGTRFALVMGLVPLLGFSLISGKQSQYLLPEFAAFALLAARALVQLPERAGRRALIVPAIGFAVLGIAMLAASHRLAVLAPDTDAVLLARIAGAVALAVGLWLGWRAPSGVADQARRLALAMVVVVAATQIAAGEALRPGYDLRPVAQRLKALQDQGLPVANQGKYHGQFHFAGRLREPLDVVDEDHLEEWLASHPGGRAVVYFRKGPYQGPGQVEYTQRYRSQRLAIVTAPAP